MSETKDALDAVERQYQDSDGNPCDLVTLCRREPEWAASRLTFERARHAEEVARLQRVLQWAVNERNDLREDLTEARDQLRKVENCGQDDVCATPPGCLRHWEERNRELVVQLRRVERERDALAVRMDLPASQLLMVGSELCGDGKIDPNDHRDPRWTPTLQQAAKVTRELAARRALDADVRACAEHCISCSRSGEATTEATGRILAALDSHECPECHMPGHHKMSCSRGGSKGARLFGSPIDESDKEPTP